MVWAVAPVMARGAGKESPTGDAHGRYSTQREVSPRGLHFEGRSSGPLRWEDPMQIKFTLERETKNTVRFAEDEASRPADHPGTPVVGTLYLQTAAHAKLGAQTGSR